MDRSFISKKCFLHKDMTHHDVLQKCIEATWGDSAGNYYLSDGSGSKISDEDLLVRGTPHGLPWSLGNFMRACNMYASRTRLYCVRIGVFTYIVSECVGITVYYTVIDEEMDTLTVDQMAQNKKESVATAVGDQESVVTVGDQESVATVGDLESMATVGDRESMATVGDRESETAENVAA